jgi:hypothetical protein
MKRRGLEFNKRAQMKLSFGMIFSIMLIVFFLIFAFFGIKKLITVQQETQINLFYQDLQQDINKIWNSDSGSNSVTYTLPKKISKVCFIEEDKNLLLYEEDDFFATKRKHIENLNLEESLNGNEELCFENLDGKVSFYLEKDYGENYVVVSE